MLHNLSYMLIIHLLLLLLLFSPISLYPPLSWHRVRSVELKRQMGRYGHQNTYYEASFLICMHKTKCEYILFLVIWMSHDSMIKIPCIMVALPSYPSTAAAAELDDTQARCPSWIVRLVQNTLKRRHKADDIVVAVAVASTGVSYRISRAWSLINHDAFQRPF